MKIIDSKGRIIAEPGQPNQPNNTTSNEAEQLKITKVAPAAKTPGRYNIFINGKYSFSLDEIQLVDAGLHSGLIISPEQLNHLKNESDFGKEYIRAIDLISRRLRSEREIRDYARRKAWPSHNTERVIERLKVKGYLNDKVFAESFVRGRLNTAKYSKKRIRLDLQKKGIDNDIIDGILHDEVSDTNALAKLIAKRAPRYHDDNKLKAYLLRNGFNYDDINNAIAEYKSSLTQSDD